MSSYLLDTHVIIWLATGPENIPQTVREKLQAAKEINISAASAFEIAQKSRIGNLDSGTAILNRWDKLIAKIGATELPLNSKNLILAGSMPWEHRDPFDRMLAATAQLYGLTLVTKDIRLQSFSEITCLEWK